ncbi:MAG: GntR family transcriptional regulator [Xanthobacteraceae bacterium]
MRRKLASPKMDRQGSTPDFRPSRLQVSTAAKLLSLIRQENMPAGEKLGEETLAAQLGVSRTSVRGALRVLETGKIVEARPRRGYRLRQAGCEIKSGTELPTSRDETLYMHIARDRLAGELPESLTETDLMRRYDAGRHLVLAALALLSEEGIVHRGLGREWCFRDILKSRRARAESYEFRLMLEPSALLLPTFHIVKPELMRMRDLQGDLLASSGKGASLREVFQTDASFHELLGSFSGNTFVLSSIRQQNRLRRLLEYQSYPNAVRVRAWCLEHISVINALLDGDQHLAARHLTKHLENARLVPAARRRVNAR